MSADKPWKIEYKDEPWYSNVQGQTSEGTGYYEITYKGKKYGFASKHCYDDMKTEEILSIMEIMMNDAHQLATQLWGE